MLGYEAKSPSPPRTWGMRGSVWLLVAGFCAFVEFAGWSATGGRIGGWADLTFIAIVAGIGLVALINALHAFAKAR